MKKPRGIFIAGNWKMNHGVKETRQFFEQFRRLYDSSSSHLQARLADHSLKAALFAPYLSISAAQGEAHGMPIHIGAQNAHWEKSGAFTGEISGAMLLEHGIKSVLVGHSERRQYFAETDETVRKKTESLIEQGLEVILCIGETRAEREAGQTEAVLLRQLSAVFQSAQSPAVRSLGCGLVLAYEPVWAIGTGLTASPEQAEEAHQIIRRFLSEKLSPEAAEMTVILYGGSVTPQNVTALLQCPNVDGGLVGGASLKPESYIALLHGAVELLPHP
ncbi:MAG: triose-phosphate isomerase [Methylotenera sp.]|nr:triose-phosphate isomerase [Oligoflexia bacterium]